MRNASLVMFGTEFEMGDKFKHSAYLKDIDFLVQGV